MKPTLTTIDNSRRHIAETRVRRASRMFPKTDYSYHAATITDFRGRCARSTANARSFRKISENYFKGEAPQNFAGEAAFFAVIVMTAALPLVNNAQALAHFIRVIGAF
jgi:hypothetical protein